MAENDYVIRVLDSPEQVHAAEWNALLAAQGTHHAEHAPGNQINPFMRHEYLAALHESGCATPATGWTARFITLWQGNTLAAACPLYLKDHSYGEYVFDWAWANAYQQHGLHYYPKAVVAPPFTPVPGARLLARTAAERQLLVKALLAWCEAEKLSSLHILFAADEDVAACEQAGLMLRHTVQFHWTNRAPTLPTSCGSLPPEGTLRLRPGKAGSAAPAGKDSEPAGDTTTSATSPAHLGNTRTFRDFDDFLMSLSQEKRKKIRQERRKVADAGITFRWSLGRDISPADWDFFYRCYERTYLEHGNAPYLSRDFFQRLADTMPEHWLLFIAEHSGTPIASSLIAVNMAPTLPTSCGSLPPGGALRLRPGEAGSAAPAERCGGGSAAGLAPEGAGLAWGGPALRPMASTLPADQPVSAAVPAGVAYGRYWGALARVDCLHFEACYYQPLQWCIAHGFQRFEGGAQGEHKMARALLPVKTTSAHWLAHPSFADAVERFLEREGAGIDSYMDDLEQRSPFKSSAPPLPHHGKP